MTSDRQALEQRDTLAQRRFEFDLATHRAFGDSGDVSLEPDKIGQLVDAFLADHGGIHVGQKKLLAPGDRRLHHDINGQVLARFAQAVSCGSDILAAVAERDVGGDLIEQPVCGPGRGQKGARAVEHRAIECGIGRMADQCGDEGHEFARS